MTEKQPKELANTGYISSIDIDDGSIESKYNDQEPDYKVLDADDAL